MYGINHKNLANSAMDMKIGGEGQFDMLKKTGVNQTQNTP